MPHVETNGLQMYYEERGEGEPLIMIMGITARGEVWDAHAEAWSQKFRCIMPDNRGVGLTDKPAGDYTSEMMADDYAGLMDALGIEKARSWVARWVQSSPSNCASVTPGKFRARFSCAPGRVAIVTQSRFSNT